jgi:hypothetical protein
MKRGSEIPGSLHSGSGPESASPCVPAGRLLHALLRCFFSLHTYPLRPVMVIPPTSFFCRKKKSTGIGSMVATLAAIR